MPNYWADRARVNEEKAQRMAATASGRQAKMYRDMQGQIRVGIDALYAQIIDQGGAEGLTRTQLWQYSKYVQLQDIIQAATKSLKGQQTNLFDAVLGRVFETTCKTTLDGLGHGHMRNAILNDQQMGQILDTVWSGRHYSSRVWANSDKIAQRIGQDISTLITLGKNPTDIKAAIKHDLNVGYREADRLVRSEANHVYNEAAKVSYRAAGVQKVELLIEDDGGQCDECNALAGLYDIDSAPILPVHPNCRCCLAPVIDL